MLWLLALCSLAVADTPPSWSALRISVECQSSGRIDACTLVQGLLDHEEVLSVVPRSAAQVTLFVNVTEQASDDMVYLRAVGDLPGAPPQYEQLQAIDSRLGVTEQQAALDPALMRCLTPFVAAQIPQAVSVQFNPPESAKVEEKTSPWGFSTWGGGWGWWTQHYQSLSLWGGASVYRITNKNKVSTWIGYDRSIERQPSLEIDGSTVSLSSDSHAVYGMSKAAWNLDDHWTLGGVLRGGFDDPEGQYAATARVHTGVERNWFPSDDPRGNKLAAAYLIGVQADQYNQINAIGEEEAIFPTHMLLMSGSVRVDTVELELSLSGQAELLQPQRRYALNVEGSTDLNVGDHVDIRFSTGVTQQAIPGPATVDRSSYEEISRASYAEPLNIYSNLNINLHWDNTNSARNNRFDTAANLGPTGNL